MEYFRSPSGFRVVVWMVGFCVPPIACTRSNGAGPRDAAADRALSGSGGAGGEGVGSGGTGTGGNNGAGGNPATGGAAAGPGPIDGGSDSPMDAPGNAAGGMGNGGTAGTGGIGGRGGGGAGGAAALVPVVLTEDGGWSWFSSTRALFQGSRLIVGSVPSGFNDATRRGDVEAIVYDTATRTSSAIELHNQLELDDHDSAALVARPDGRLLAVYGRHDAENHFYYRISQPNDPLTWTAEQTFIPSASTQLTYSNLVLVPGENNRIYDFYRGLDASFKPSYAYSTDMGQTWTSGNVFIQFPVTFRHRPYVRYASNGTDTIHLIYTEGHPRDFDTSIYHVSIRAGTIYRSDGTAIHPLSQGLVNPMEGTLIFQSDAQHVAWTVDIVLDSAQRPVVAYSVQVGSAGLPVGQGGDDIRYRYARFDGAAWQDHALAFAGSRLYAGEDDYSGLVAIDPGNPSVVYLSTNANPVTGAPLMSTADGLRHYEIYRGITGDGGATWTFTSVTQNSAVDNLRPVLPPAGTGGRRALLWLRGTYTSYINYRQQIVAAFWNE